MNRRILLAVLVVVAVAIGVFVAFGDDAESAEERFVDTLYVEEPGDWPAHDIRTPEGDTSVYISPPLDRIPEEWSSANPLESGEGHSYVVVGFPTPDTGPSTWTQRSLAILAPEEPRLTLVIGERRYPITDALTSRLGTSWVTSGEWYVVPVEGDGADLAELIRRVEITYDEATQVVDARRGLIDRGGAEALYGPRADGQDVDGTYRPVDIPSAWGRTHDTEYQYQGHRVAYYPGLGWAPRGHEWLVVVASAYPYSRFELAHPGAADAPLYAVLTHSMSFEPDAGTVVDTPPAVATLMNGRVLMSPTSSSLVVLRVPAGGPVEITVKDRLVAALEHTEGVAGLPRRIEGTVTSRFTIPDRP